ncbi:MAG: hypothetical protein HUK06_09485, partial [Bacteroidaceae bacterium]|nr:hypothetical protein [Bacteroidaceae bacterium]
MLCSLTANAQTNNKAYLFAKGSFYTVSVASDANPRVDVSTGGEQPGGVYVALGFNATDNPFNIKAQNESKSFFVYKNGVAVENTQKGIDANMFDAQVTLANNDVVKVFSSKPMQTTVNFGFMNGPFDAYANQVEVTMDKVVAVPNYHEVANVLEGTEFQVKAKEGYEIESVTYCNNDITPVDGVYSFVVNEANPLCNITMKQAKPAANAVLYLKGDKFYTFSIQDQNAADPREEIYSETLAGKVVDKYVGLNVNDGMSVRLVGNIKQGSTFAVYHNGVKVESIQQDMFEATLNLNPSSVLKVYDAEPMKTVVNIGFMNAGPTRIWASQVDVTKDVIIPVADITNPISVDLGTKISIKAKEGYEIVDVTYCNESVTPVDGVYSFQVYAENTLANITMKEAAKTATAYVNGQFHTITASNAEGEALNVTQGTYAGDYFPFAPGNYTLRSYNEANEFHVYLDGAAVANTIDTGSTGFLAEIDVKDGSVLKLFNAAPFTSKVEFGSQGMPVAKLAELVEVTMDKVVSHNITNAVQALKGTEFAIKAKAGNEITEVIVNNQPIYPNDGVYTAKVSQEGDMLVIINMKDSRKTAYAYLNGNIYTATVSDKSIEDPKSAEILNVIYQEGYDEYREMKFNETSSAFVVKATTKSKAPFVYVDGVKYESTAEEGNPYEAEVTLNNNSILKIYDIEPFTTNMQIGFMGSRAKDAQKVVVTMDKVTPVDVTLDQVYNVLQGTEFQITTKKGYGYEIKSVTVNNTPVYPSGDVYKVKASQEGDMLINIEMVTDEKQAKAYINGQFNTFTATDAASEGGRDQILDVTQGDNYDEYRTMNFVPGHRYSLKGQNKNSNTFFVYLNGKAVPSTGIAGEMYEAQIELNENDILKVYDAEPFNTKMEISFMQSRTEVAHQVEVTYDQVNKVSTTALQYPETSVFVVSKGTEFAIKAKDGYQIAGVYYCNEPLYPDYNNV